MDVHCTVFLSFLVGFCVTRQSEVRYDHFEAMQVRDKLDSLRPVAWTKSTKVIPQRALYDYSL